VGKFWLLSSLALFIIAAGCTASAPAASQVTEPAIDRGTAVVSTPAAPQSSQPAVEQKPLSIQPVGTAVKVEPTAAQGIPTNEAASTDSLPQDGQTLLENRCTTCHDITVIELKSESAEEWEQIVMQMIQNGAFLTSDEKQFLIEYLAETYPEK